MTRRWPDKTGACINASCRSCRTDLAFLLGTRQPYPRETYTTTIRAVDLFAGCGGMSVGLQEAAHREKCSMDIPLAVDVDPGVIDVYQANLPGATALTADLRALFDGSLGGSLTLTEKRQRRLVGPVDILLGGPPCQGHSDLNNHTRRDDPKNDLYLVMARAAEVLRPTIVMIENVVPVVHDKSRVVDVTRESLMAAGYRVTGRVIDLRRIGVPQKRRRYLLLASRLRTIDPGTLLDDLVARTSEHPNRSVRWAIEDLAQIEEGSTYDTAGRTSPENKRRIDYLFEKGLFDLPNSQRPECHRYGGHTYVSMYGRLTWDEPAQTITTGFGSMGQGRYIHPSRRRTITPHEAARLQTFPDWFDFGRNKPRAALAKMIGNAVPPLLMVSLGCRIVRALKTSSG